MNTEAVNTPEKLVATYQTTRYYNPEDHNMLGYYYRYYFLSDKIL
jgi:hypothetical protein